MLLKCSKPKNLKLLKVAKKGKKNSITAIFFVIGVNRKISGTKAQTIYWLERKIASWITGIEGALLITYLAREINFMNSQSGIYLYPIKRKMLLTR